MTLRLAALVWFLTAPGTALAQTVTNLTSTDTFTSLTDALAKGSAGDKYEIDGDLVEQVTIEQSVILIGAASGATVSWGDDSVIVLEEDITLTMQGIDLTATGKNWAIEAPGGNTITVSDAEIDGAGSYVHAEGGIVHVLNPISVSFEDVTFRGSPGVDLTSTGGAIWAAVVGTTAALDLTDVSFVDVEAKGHGGAVASYGLSTTCVGCSFTHTAGGFGGAIFASGALSVVRSTFCDTSGTLGGAIFASQDTDVLASVFVETKAGSGAALYVNGGDWLVRNNHFLGGDGGSTGGTIFGSRAGTSITVRNSLFLDDEGVGLALAQLDSASRTLEYNWFTGNVKNADVVLGAKNDVSGTDPELVDWTPDENCSNDELWPTPFTSPLLDAGDPSLKDPDGTRSDVGAYGGPNADASLYGDADADGVGFFWDCDDADPAISSKTEVFPDCDGDGQGRDARPRLECFAPEVPAAVCKGAGGWALERKMGGLANADCDDTRFDRHVGADETCEPLDLNCDGHPYDGAVDMTEYFLDMDRDGFGAVEFYDCGRIIPGWSRVGGDCDDADPDVFPDAPDLCGDDVDQDCDGADGEGTGPWYTDEDSDGFGAAAEPAFEACYPAFRPGFVRNTLDCDDTDPLIRPEALELCDGIDQDCDGSIDNPTAPRPWFLDADGDGFGDPSELVEAGCAPDESWVPEGGDCDDDDPTTYQDCTGCGCQTASPHAGWLVLGLLLVMGLRRRGGAA